MLSSAQAGCELLPLDYGLNRRHLIVLASFKEKKKTALSFQTETS